MKLIQTKQKNQPIKLYYDVNINKETGECSQSYYDSELIMKIKGLVCSGKTFVTRLFPRLIRITINGLKCLKAREFNDSFEF